MDGMNEKLIHKSLIYTPNKGKMKLLRYRAKAQIVDINSINILPK